MSKTAIQPEMQSDKDLANPQAFRETVESIVVAVILAFLFRAFVAEAFVIPTGSMAPTLQGRHLDVKCPQCKYRYRTGASMENDGSSQRVTKTTCPICRYQQQLDRSPQNRTPLAGVLSLNNQDSFSGDRILVSKFAYQLGEPRRWDVIVFKYPGNAKQNYIKRLVGLPGETIVIEHGDILIAPPSEREKDEDERLVSIARKPPSKLKAMLQLVDDTNHIAPQLLAVGWPLRWQSSPRSDGWTISPEGNNFKFQSSAESTSWLRYRHLVPGTNDWPAISDGRLPAGMDQRMGQLITDYYEYNDFYPGRQTEPASSFGSCWVGDLALECNLEVESDSGELALDLVEGGVHYTCRIDIKTGVATLSIAEGRESFVDGTGNKVVNPAGETKVKGRGRYHLRLTNVDNQVLLWVNERLIEFDGPTTYVPPNDVQPKWSPSDAGDLEPAGVGGRGASFRVTRLRVLRDIYYQAVSSEQNHKSEYTDPFELRDEIRRVFSNPHEWATTDLFRRRVHVVYPLADDQFFPLGDNSPQSKDARLWTEYNKLPPASVARELLIGKALLIYWPHRWRPLLPNFERMGLIR